MEYNTPCIIHGAPPNKEKTSEAALEYLLAKQDEKEVKSLIHAWKWRNILA